jgi:hypothetical protein
MTTLAEQINNQIDAGRHQIERSLREMRDLDVRRMPPAGIVAAVGVTAAAAFAVGWMVYRNRRRRTLVQRLQDALPDPVRDLPAGVRLQVKRVRSM